MKYIFIMNPTAGEHTAGEEEKYLEQYNGKVDYMIYLTIAQKDARVFVENYCNENPDEEVCFVACGGDGTVNEVISGLVGRKNKYFAILSHGSGNDFIKCFPDKDFTNIDKLFAGSVKQIDAMQVNDNDYSVNVINIGFDANVASVANKAKLKGSKDPYGKGVFNSIFTARKNKIDIYVEGEKIGDEKMLMCNLSNGKYCGGKYLCAPLSVMDDGLMEVAYFRKISLFRFLKILKPYELGQHLNNPKTEDIVIYKRAKEVKIVSNMGTIDLSLDGEIISGTEFTVKALEKALNFIVPADEV